MAAQVFKNTSSVNEYIAHLDVYIRKANTPTSNLLYRIVDLNGSVLIDTATFATPAAVGATLAWVGLDLPPYTYFTAGHSYELELFAQDNGGTSTTNYYWWQPFLAQTNSINFYPGGTYTDDSTSYGMRSNALGPAGLTKLSPEGDFSFRFGYDTEAPDVNITSPNPANSSKFYLSSLAQVSGNGSDPNFTVPASSGAQVAILDQTPGFNKYWQAGTSSWVDNLGTVVWNSTSTTGGAAVTWAYSIVTASNTVVGGANNHVFRVVARTNDESMNYSSPYSTITFVIDYQAPMSTVTSPAAGNPWMGSLSSISGVASDNSQGGISLLKYSIKNLATNKWWTGSDFTSTAEQFLNADSIVAGSPAGEFHLVRQSERHRDHIEIDQWNDLRRLYPVPRPGHNHRRSDARPQHRSRLIRPIPSDGTTFRPSRPLRRPPMAVR